MKPHALVAMPFGTKPDASGQRIDFNRVYADYIWLAMGGFIAESRTA